MTAVVTLSSQDLTSIDKCSFSGLVNMYELDLSSNLLTTLDVTLFNGLTALRTLYLSSNQLSNLNIGFFSSLINQYTNSVLKLKSTGYSRRYYFQWTG